jgi:hypothetical protein
MVTLRLAPFPTSPSWGRWFWQPETDAHSLSGFSQNPGVQQSAEAAGKESCPGFSSE